MFMITYLIFVFIFVLHNGKYFDIHLFLLYFLCFYYIKTISKNFFDKNNNSRVKF